MKRGLSGRGFFFFFSATPPTRKGGGGKRTDESAVAAASIAALLAGSIGELKQRTEEAAALYELRIPEEEKSDTERRGSSLHMRCRSRRRSSTLTSLARRLPLAAGPTAAAAAGPPPPASGNEEVRKEAVVALETLNEPATRAPAPSSFLLAERCKKRKETDASHFFLSLAHQALRFFPSRGRVLLLQLLFHLSRSAACSDGIYGPERRLRRRARAGQIGLARRRRRLPRRRRRRRSRRFLSATAGRTAARRLLRRPAAATARWLPAAARRRIQRPWKRLLWGAR